MIKLSTVDEKYLRSKIEKGEVILVLGAGCVRTCTNAKNKLLKAGEELAKKISEDAGYEYNGEDLPTVLDAVQLPTPQFNELLEAEYRGCTPSPELNGIFHVPWWRIYTFNIDDSIEGLQGIRSKQRIYPYNAMHSKVAPHEGPNALHLVHLNGYVRELDKGVIFSKLDYDKRVSQADAYWYREFATDHFRNCSIFIGTRLNEPLLWAALESVREASPYSRSFLIIPDELSALQIAGLKARGITFLRGTFEDFVALIKSLYPDGMEWGDVIAQQSGIPKSKDLKLFSKDDVEALNFAKRIEPPKVAGRWIDFSEQEKRGFGSDFYMGQPSSWEVAASDVPVDLSQNKFLQEFLGGVVQAESPLIVVTGQAGCGKSTAIMQTLLKYVSLHDDVDLVELSPDVVSLTRTLRAGRKFSDKKVTLFFVPDLHPFGAALKEDVQRIPDGAIIVSTAREGEWHGNFKRHLGAVAKVFEYKRFEPEDEPKLIAQLSKYVASPDFAKLSFEEKLKRLRNSKRQLLIALREVTDSPNFDRVIRHEYESLSDRGHKVLFGIIAVSTLARTGIRPEMAFAAYQAPVPAIDFNEALAGLHGMVFEGVSGRLFVRHEIYARYILEGVMPFSEITEAIRRILLQFTKYRIPIIRSAPRTDAALFKFLLNNNFVFELADTHGVKDDGLAVFQQFEVPFQLDGHFWLQYGLYYDRLGLLAPAEDMLRRSIQAYPENAFAEHALARTRLRIAIFGHESELETKRRIDSAVESLNKLDSRDPTSMDEYPIVTLAFFHVEAVLRNYGKEEALKIARQYLARLKYIERRTTGDSVKVAIEQLMIFITTGDWRPGNKRW